MEILIIISLFVGIVIGAGLVRYGIGLGYRMVYQVKEDIPTLNGKEEPTEQDFTEDME